MLRTNGFRGTFVLHHMLRQVAASEEGGSGSRWVSSAGQVTLSALLRALCALSDTSKGVDLLRRQGAVHALLCTLDSNNAKTADVPGAPPSAATLAASSGATVRGVGSKSPPIAVAGSGAATAPDDSDASPAASTGNQLSPEATALVLGILSKLMDMSDLAEGKEAYRSTDTLFF